MTNRIPQDAFEFYVGLGADRSYRQVARHYGVSKRGVAKAAVREQWSKRLAQIETESRERGDQKIADKLVEAQERHLTTLRAMNMRALEALKQHPLSTGMEAIKAAEIAIKLERLILGESTDRSALQVEEAIHREYDRWLRRAPDEDDDEEDDDLDDDEAVAMALSDDEPSDEDEAPPA